MRDVFIWVRDFVGSELRGLSKGSLLFLGDACQKKHDFCQKRNVSDFGVYDIIIINTSFCTARRENLFLGKT